MKKIFFLILVLTVPMLVWSYNSDTKNKATEEIKENKVSFGYFNVGVGPFPFPGGKIAFGGRIQSGCGGGDFSVNLATVIFETQLKAKGLLLCYPCPNVSSEFYAGLGGGIGVATRAITVGPESLLGVQFQSKTGRNHFIQAEISCPTFILAGAAHSGIFVFPLVWLSYGIGF